MSFGREEDLARLVVRDFKGQPVKVLADCRLQRFYGLSESDTFLVVQSTFPNGLEILIQHSICSRHI